MEISWNKNLKLGTYLATTSLKWFVDTSLKCCPRVESETSVIHRWWMKDIHLGLETMARYHWQHKSKWFPLKFKENAWKAIKIKETLTIGFYDVNVLHFYILSFVIYQDNLWTLYFLGILKYIKGINIRLDYNNK